MRTAVDVHLFWKIGFVMVTEDMHMLDEPNCMLLALLDQSQQVLPFF